MPSKGFQPTPEQIALAQERKLKREQKRKEAEEQAAREEELKGQILPRDWVSCSSSQVAVTPATPNVNRLRVMTWNVGLFWLFRH